MPAGLHFPQGSVKPLREEEMGAHFMTGCEKINKIAFYLLC